MLSMAVARSSSVTVTIRYVLPVLWMTSHLRLRRVALPLQQVASLRRRAQVNASAASYWLRRAVDDGGRRDCV